ncbi:MAG TPA: hypothetical protein VMM76_08900 [Pirellulaceae bacterium]|nr:hypothetical protein [Pirellulaceae bacterium]
MASEPAHGSGQLSLIVTHLKLADMDDEHKHAIPAASIGDTDLDAVARHTPAAAKEIARLEDLMNRGEDTNDEFLLLCRLLFDVGSVGAAEVLLRRNLDYSEGDALYAELFGTEKQEEFYAAIQAFESQFNIQLSLTAKNDFLVATFHAEGGPPRSDDFELLSQPCEIKIGYIERDKIEADIVLLDPNREVFDADECLFMYFVKGVWEIADPMDA